MFFRKKSETENPPPASTSYALIPIYRGKTKSVIGDRIVKIIQESNLCPSNPFIKRLIVRNIQVCCVVFETCGGQSFKIIFASVPLLVNLLSRTNPKVRAFLEDGRVVPYINFFQEIDFECVLSSLCSATLILQSGIQKCYPIACVQLGRDVLFFSKRSLHYIMQLFLAGALYVVHYIFEDLPHVLQTLCAQNYTVAKYCVQNLPLVALVGAKQFVLFTLFVQRVVTAAVKSVKRCAKLFCRILVNLSSSIDASKLCQDLYSLLKLTAKRLLSTSSFKKLKSVLLQLFDWCLPLLQKSAPLILKTSTSSVRKITPVLRQLIDHFRRLLPKLYRHLERNKDVFIYVYSCVVECMKLILQRVKPFSSECCKIFLSAANSFVDFAHCVAPVIKDMYSSSKSFLRDGHLQKHVCMVFYEIKKRGPAFYKLVQRVCYYIFTSLKFYFQLWERSLPYLIRLFQKVCSNFFCLYQEMSPILRPVVLEANSVIHNCSKEVATKTACGFQRVVPSVWRGLKTVTPVTFHASNEIALTVRMSVSVIYPELLKAARVLSPELSRGVFVVLRDSGKAYMEIAHSCYHLSQETLQVTKCVSKNIPVVLKAVSEVTLTTSGAISEVISTSSKAGIRARADVQSAVRTVRSAFDLAELELLTTVNEIALDVSDHKEILEVTILLKKTGKVFIATTSKQCYSSLKNASYSVAMYSANRIQDMHKFTKYVNLLKPQLISNIFFKFLGFKCSPNQSVKSLSQTVCLKCHNLIISYMSSTSDALSELMSVVHHDLCQKTHQIWQLSKDTNAILWLYFCQSAFNMWTFLERSSIISWEITCACAPDLWNNCKSLSSKTWELTCEFSPVLWKAALPIFPVLWSSHCDVVQCMWEIQLSTCNKTWNLVVPLSSAGWERAVQTFPKLWFTLCENSKTGWDNLCDTVELGWNATTKTSSLSWHLFHKTVSKSWKHALRPVTTSTCSNISSAVAHSIKVSYKVCAEAKKFTYFL